MKKDMKSRIRNCPSCGMVMNMVNLGSMSNRYLCLSCNALWHIPAWPDTELRLDESPADLGKVFVWELGRLR